jgi:transcriptional regulator
VSRLIGKWKVSQNRSDADRTGVADGLAQLDDTQAQDMADLVAKGITHKRPV